MEGNDQEREIRFYKNGNPLGHFELVKGKLDGGHAFDNIPNGTYYPAVSTYMGGSVQANFGPYWICNVKKTRMPYKNLQSFVQRPEIWKVPKLFKNQQLQKDFEAAVQVETDFQQEQYDAFVAQHVQEIRRLRTERGLATNDLPEAAANDVVKMEE